MNPASISVIVMAFNEADSVESVVREIQARLQETGWPHELIIVDDGSSDGTDIIAERLAAQLPHLRVIHHDQNQGLGGVYRTGFVQARGDFVTFFPADGQFPATIITQFVPLMHNNVDMVLGYVPKRPDFLVGKVLSLVEKFLYRVLFGPLPKFQGILMFRRTLLQAIPLTSTGRGWAVLIEFIIRASRSGCKIVSVPTEMHPRLSGTSKVNNLPTILANLKQVLGLIRHLS